MYRAPHHAWHPSRATVSSNNSGCSGVAIIVLVVMLILLLLAQCGKQDYKSNNTYTYTPNNRNMSSYSDTSSYTYANTYTNSSTNNTATTSSYNITSGYTPHDNKTEFVNGYRRKDGTYVHSYYRKPRK